LWPRLTVSSIGFTDFFPLSNGEAPPHCLSSADPYRVKKIVFGIAIALRKFSESEKSRDHLAIKNVTDEDVTHVDRMILVPYDVLRTATALSSASNISLTSLSSISGNSSDHFSSFVSEPPVGITSDPNNFLFYSHSSNVFRFLRELSDVSSDGYCHSLHSPLVLDPNKSSINGNSLLLFCVSIF
jgi:hypothetical protein